MIKKMSLVGISFAFLGLAFICESANAVYYCHSGTKPSTNASAKNTTNRCNTGEWACNSGYYFFNNTVCKKYPSSSDTHLGISQYINKEGFECGNNTYLTAAPTSSSDGTCAPLPAGKNASDGGSKGWYASDGTSSGVGMR